MKYVMLGLLCLCVSTVSEIHAAGQVLPDELTLNVGDVANVGTNVTLVLTKRSVRSAQHVYGVWSDKGFKKMEFPVSTYRGYVQGDPALRVVANIQPGGILNAYISAGRQHVGSVEKMKIKVPQGKCTPITSTGNKIVPLKSLPARQLPTASGCLVPRVPMRQSQWVVYVPQSYTAHTDLETIVSRVESRWNDGDHVFARDVGIAWEIDVMVLYDPKCTTQVDWNQVFPNQPDRIKNHMHGHVSGVPGRNHGKGSSLAVAGDGCTASILLHEGAHCYGNPYHQMDPRDGLFGGGAFFGRNNVQVLVDVTETPGAWCHRGEDIFPGVVYNGVLPPSAMRDMANTPKDKPVSIDVLENDYDGNGDEISLQAVTPTSEKGGNVVVSDDKRKAIYTPPPGFVGLDQFTYSVVDSTGAANKSGIVKVDVRDEGLVVYCDFEHAKKDNLEWLKKNSDWRMWYYDYIDKRPESEKVTYHFRNLGPYDWGHASAQWIDYVPVKGVRGNGLLNPIGGHRAAQVDLSDAGDPGRASLSASIWVMFPQPIKSGVILCKSSYGFKTLMGGWAIRCTDTGFSFFGNAVRLRPSELFEVHSEEPIESNKWYHLVMVMDRQTKKLRAYVNNQEVTASSTTSRIPDAVIEYHAPLRLFNGPGWKGWSAQPMLVDEVKIFTKALTPKEVAELYAEGKDAKTPTLPKLEAAK